MSDATEDILTAVGPRLRALRLRRNVTLAELSEATVDDGWVAAKPTWERFRGHPVSAAFVWTRPA